MHYLQPKVRRVRDLVWDRQEPDFKKLETFLNKLRVKVQTGPGGQRSRIKTIRGLEPMAGEFKFTNSDHRPTTVKVRLFSSLPLNMAYSSILTTGLFSRNVQHPHQT